jgi:hypothetical protein
MRSQKIQTIAAAVTTRPPSPGSSHRHSLVIVASVRHLNLRHVAGAVGVIGCALALSACGGSSAGTHSTQRPIRCSTKDSRSCYYVNSGRLVPPNPQTVSYKGMAVPTVGILPPQCSTDTACTYVGNTGSWQVWNTNPKGSSHLEATYGAPSNVPSDELPQQDAPSQP